MPKDIFSHYVCMYSICLHSMRVTVYRDSLSGVYLGSKGRVLVSSSSVTVLVHLHDKPNSHSGSLSDFLPIPSFLCLLQVGMLVRPITLY